MKVTRRGAMPRPTLHAAAVSVLALSACSSQPEPGSMPGDLGDDSPFAAISEGDTVRFTGTEPFWGGQVAGTALTYSTPEIPDGTDITVVRFAGRGGVSWSGMYEGSRLVLAVTPGDCSDGMSDRTYPYTATLEVNGEQRSGCAWTERQSFTEPDPPGETMP
ncbi:COG3650 family protein [Tsuneonella sp. SYSU-LHT278]|uniref:COG3650 family protein n=1 Tax=Tsuneonella sediminis TaxID=3416089 RepID=UPI003F7A8B63